MALRYFCCACRRSFPVFPFSQHVKNIYNGAVWKKSSTKSEKKTLSQKRTQRTKGMEIMSYGFFSLWKSLGNHRVWLSEKWRSFWRHYWDSFFNSIDMKFSCCANEKIIMCKWVVWKLIFKFWKPISLKNDLKWTQGKFG